MPGTDIEIVDENEVALEAIQGPVGLFGVASPAEVVASATDVATALADVIEQRGLFQNIRGKKHVTVEGWTLLGTMLGVFPVVEWTHETEDGWEARVTARTKTGAVVGAAEAMCSRSETRWRNADDYAIRSMAQTRATSKALRLPLGFVMPLAGYEATPQEEMVNEPRQASTPLVDMSPETLTALLQAIPKAEFHDPDRWNLQAVLGTASRVFGRQIERLADLQESEAQRILEGALASIEAGEQEYAAAAEAGEIDPEELK